MACPRQRRHTRRERHLRVGRRYEPHIILPSHAARRSRLGCSGGGAHSGFRRPNIAGIGGSGAGSHRKVPGKTAPREAACTGSTRRLVRYLAGTGNRHPGLRAGIVGRVVPSGTHHGTIGRAKTTKVKTPRKNTSGPRLVKLVSRHLERPSFGQNSVLSPDWSLTTSQ
jgi:hypothetical protein